MRGSFRFWSVVGVILLMVTAACRVRIPRTESVVLGQIRTLSLNEALPAASVPVMDVRIVMGAGDLKISGGSTQLLEGSVEYNVADWEPEVVRGDRSLELRQGMIDRSIDLTALDRVVNRWSLQFGEAPVDLTISAGAYDGQMDLSGIPLTGLDISDGASHAEVVFDRPNPVEMEHLSYRTGASDVTLTGLGNANFRRMIFDGGAGSYALDFSGMLQQDALVTINGGLGDFTLTIPADTAAEVDFKGELMNVNTRGTWVLQDDLYISEGSGPLLKIEVNVGLGSITLVRE